MSRSICLIFICFLCYSCIHGQSNIISLNASNTDLNQENLINQFSNQEQDFYFFDSNLNYKLTVGEAIVVFQADKSEDWGYVQFPSIQVTQSGDYLVMWNLSEDKIGSAFKKGWKYSKDGGKKWFFNWKRKPDFKGEQLNNNEYIKLGNYTTKDIGDKKIIKSYKVNNKVLNLYEHDKLFPIEIYRKSFIEKDFIKEKAQINYNNQVYEYSIDGYIPSNTWGKIESKGEKELYKIQYPIYLKAFPNYASIAWLYSEDNGYNWNTINFIPFGDKEKKEISKYVSDIQGFDEASFVRYSNDDLLVVARTTTGLEIAPLLQFKSSSNGKKWSEFEVISPNGVFPQLLKLNEELTVLSYGRPGVQIRISNNQGKTWSDSLNFLKFEGLKGQVSCGYTGMLKINDTTFLMVYSDFQTKNKDNQIRKSIIVRKIKIEKC